jgi:exodeoxyribonuclease V gamma subunit
MAGFKLYTSNRLESLLDGLASVVSEPLASPMVSEVIVVQSKGMERWLSMELAKKLGIWMNCRFPFPNKFVWEMFAAVIPELPDLSLFSPQVMTWRIMKQLPEYIQRPAFDIIANYIDQDSNCLKRFQLSERIADAFDRYSIYRPAMVLEWDEGKDGENQSEQWQAELWRGLFGGEIKNHRAGILRDFLKSLPSYKDQREKLPERISIFGIPALPGYHFEVFNALASLIDVHFFLLGPTREFWADIVPEKRIGVNGGSTLHFEAGNPLLASMGKLGRDFFSLVVNRDYGYEEYPSFDEPGADSLLASLQSDILNLRARGVEDKGVVHFADRSVQVHSCHSPMREVEVLYDHLLHFFEQRPGLTPKDIIVMTPDIEAYAPYITAIFSGGISDKNKIPFSIADRRALSESHVIDVFLKIINLKGGRLSAPAIIDLLDSPVIQERFGFRPEDMELIIRWINETHIYWGIDGAHRERAGLPPFEEGSWKAGIRRLLLGYALRGDQERLFHNILPYDDIEGNDTEVLGRFLEFLSTLFSTVSVLEGKRTLAEWTILLESLLARYVAEDQENHHEMQIVRTKINDFTVKQILSGFTEPLELEVIRYCLTRELKNEELSVGFMTGSVTFCEMLPMRSIPFRVVALIGMNSDAYPREYRPVGFDLIAHNPKPGDRSLRDEDRYLFLEAILSSRECLYMSYVGQSIRDNSEIPPSVLVNELLDHIDQGFQMDSGAMVRTQVVQKHRLQPFNSAYFSGDKRLFSYSREDCETAKVSLAGTAWAKPFIVKPLKQTPVEYKDITISDLKRFFRNPSRYFLNRCLGIYLDEGTNVPDEHEPLYGINALEQYKLKGWLTSKKMDGNDLRKYFALVKGQGGLPPATPGAIVYKEVSQQVEEFFQELKSHIGSERLPPLDADIRVDDFRITGRLENIWKENLVGYECVEKDKARHHLDTWIDHIVLNCMNEPKYPKASMFVRVGTAWFFNPVEDGKPELKKLLSCYLRGLAEPLRFFPKTSMKYAERFMRNRRQDEAFRSARTDWEGSDFSRGEKDDPYYKLCFDHVDPLDDTFASIALDIFKPLIQKRDKVNK